MSAARFDPVDDSPVEAEFRAEARAFLEAHAQLRTGVGDWSTPTTFVDARDEAEFVERCRNWQRTLYDHGWAGITWPVEHGGLGGEVWQAIIFDQELARVDATSGFIASTLALVGPVLMAHATPEQQQEHLRPLLSGEVLWCQLFSEPGAGSDLANVATRAVLDGDEFVVTGQKVWTSGAHHAHRGILLARTDPDAPKHSGITFLIVDMAAPGVEVRPLRQMTGGSHFDEVFLTEVRIPVTDVVGEVNAGWGPARTVLSSESTLVGGGVFRADGSDQLIELARRQGRSADLRVRQELARSHSCEVLLDLMTTRVRNDVRKGRPPSIDGSLLKIYWSRSRIHRADLAVELLGAAGITDAGEDATAVFWANELLNRFWGSIGGGTDEVHRNNLAERALGLPPEPRIDKHRPWREQQTR